MIDRASIGAPRARSLCAGCCGQWNIGDIAGCRANEKRLGRALRQDVEKRLVLDADRSTESICPAAPATTYLTVSSPLSEPSKIVPATATGAGTVCSVWADAGTAKAREPISNIATQRHGSRMGSFFRKRAGRVVTGRCDPIRFRQRNGIDPNTISETRRGFVERHSPAKRVRCPVPVS